MKEVDYEAKEVLQTNKVLETLQKQKEIAQRGNIKEYIQELENKSIAFEKESVSSSFPNIKKSSIKQQLQQNEKKKKKKRKE